MVIKLRYGKIGIVLLIAFALILSITSIKNYMDITESATLSSNAIYLPIIMYHEVKPFKVGKDVITPYEFESDLKYLTENNYSTITMTQLIDYVYNNNELPEKPIILSFDDGYLNNYKYVLPLLKKYNMKIVFSLLGKNTDEFTNIPDNNIDYSHVTWDQMNEMLSSGYVEIQNHTYNLHSINKGRVGCKQKPGESFEKYEQVLINDIGGFQDKIKLMTGVTPNTFAYPYGSYNENTDIILKKLGFQASLSCKYGINVIAKNQDNLYGLKRICRSHGKGIGKVLNDAMKTVKKHNSTNLNDIGK